MGHSILYINYNLFPKFLFNPASMKELQNIISYLIWKAHIWNFASEIILLPCLIDILLAVLIAS